MESSIRSRLWNGLLNVKVVLDQHEAGEDLVSYLFRPWRISYFPVYLPQIINFFNSFGTQATHWWLSSDGVPLQWHLPVGVLYDTLVQQTKLNKKNDPIVNDPIVWTLHLHTNSYPAEIIPFYGAESVDFERSLRETLVNQLKQLCFAANGSAKNMLNLSENHTSELWNAIVAHNRHSFDAVNRRIVPVSAKRTNYIPMKVYIKGSSGIIHAPVLPQKEGVDISFREVMNSLLRDVLGKVFVHGVDVQLVLDDDVSVYEVWCLFRHCDNFLYVVWVNEK